MAEDGRASSTSGCSIASLSELHEQQHTHEEGGALWAQREDLPASLGAAADRVQMAVDFVDSLMKHSGGLRGHGTDRPPLSMRQGEQQRSPRGPASWPEREPSGPAGLDFESGVPLEAASLFCLSTDVSLEAMMVEQQPPQHLQQQQQQQQQPDAPMDPQGPQGEAAMPDGYSSTAPPHSPKQQCSDSSSSRRSICSVKEALSKIHSRSLMQRKVADKVPRRGAYSKVGSSVGVGGVTDAPSDGPQEAQLPSAGASRTIPPSAEGPGGAGSSSRAAAPPVMEPGPPRTPLDARQQRRRSRSAALGRLKARRSLDVSCASTPGRPRLSSPSSSRLPDDIPTARESSTAVAPEASAASAARPALEHIKRPEALRIQEAGSKGPGCAGARSSSSSSREGSKGFLGAAPQQRHAEETLIATPARSNPADSGYSQRRPSSGSASRGPGGRSIGRHERPAKPLLVRSQQQLEPRRRSSGGDGSERGRWSVGGGGDAGALSARLEGLATEWQQREGERRRRQQREEERRRRQQQLQWDEEEPWRKHHQMVQEEERRRQQQQQQQQQWDEEEQWRQHHQRVQEEEEEQRRQQWEEEEQWRQHHQRVQDEKDEEERRRQKQQQWDEEEQRRKEERRQQLLQQQQQREEEQERRQQQEEERRRQQQVRSAGREAGAAAQGEGDWAEERPWGRRGAPREDAPTEATAQRLHKGLSEGLQMAPPDLRPYASEARKQRQKQQQRNPPSPGSGLLSEVQQRVDLLETLVQRAQEQEASEQAPAAAGGASGGAGGGIIGTPPASGGTSALLRATLSPEASGSAAKLISRLRSLESVVLERLEGSGGPVAERLEGRMDAVFAAGMAAARRRRKRPQGASAGASSSSMVSPEEEEEEPKEQPQKSGHGSRGAVRGGGEGGSVRPELPLGCPHDSPNPPPQGQASEAPVSFTTPWVQPLSTSRLEHQEHLQWRPSELEGAAAAAAALPPNPGAAPTPLYEPYQELPGPSRRRAGGGGGGASVMSDDARRGASVGPMQGSGPSSRSRRIQEGEDEEEDLDGEWLVRMLQSATPRPSVQEKDGSDRGRKAQAAEGLRSTGPGAPLRQQGRQQQQRRQGSPGRPGDPSLWASLQDMEATVRSCSLRLGASSESTGASSAALSKRDERRPQDSAKGSSSGPARPAPGEGAASSQQRLDQYLSVQQEGISNNGSSSDGGEDWVEAERRRFQLIMQYSWKLGFASPTPASAAGQHRRGTQSERLPADEAHALDPSAAEAAGRPGSKASSSLHRQGFSRVPRQDNERNREEGAAEASSCPTVASGSPRAAGEPREGGTKAPLKQLRQDAGGGREAPGSRDAASEFSRLVDEADKLGSNLRAVQSYLDGLHEAPLTQQQQQQVRPPLPHGSENLVSSSRRRRIPQEQEQQQISQAQGPQMRLPAALPQPYLQGTAVRQSHQRSWRRGLETKAVPGEASASRRSSSACASPEDDQSEGQDVLTLGGSLRSLRSPRTGTAVSTEQQASSGSRVRQQLRAALECHAERLVRSGRAAAGLRETLGRHQEVISQLLGEGAPHQQQQRRNRADLVESVQTGSGWRDMEGRAGGLLADARALRSEVDARAASQASLEVQGMSAGRGKGGVRAWSGLLAECIAAERQAAALQSLCLQQGRAATSQAERCSTAVSDAEAAAREAAQLRHYASLAELELVPGRIAAADDSGTVGSLTSRVASRVRRIGNSAAALGNDLEDAVREAATLGDVLAELLESRDRAAAEADAIRAHLAGLKEKRRSMMEAAAGARHDDEPLSDLTVGPPSGATTARRPGGREDPVSDYEDRRERIDHRGSVRGSPQACSPPPVAPAARSLAMAADDSPFPPAASGFSTPGRDHPQDFSRDYSLNRGRQGSREEPEASRRPIIDGCGVSQSSGVAARAPSNGAMSSSLAAALRRVRGDRPLPAASTRRLSSAISRLEHGRALARRQRGREGDVSFSRASAMSSRANSPSESDG